MTARRKPQLFSSSLEAWLVRGLIAAGATVGWYAIQRAYSTSDEHGEQIRQFDARIDRIESRLASDSAVREALRRHLNSRIDSLR